MTHIMHKTYGYTAKGGGAFAFNRMLRLYPSYWTVLALTVCIIWMFGEEEITTYRYVIYLPETIGAWISNLLLIYPSPSPQSILPRLSPPTWALTVELFYYACIGLGITKSKQITLIFCITSCVYLLLQEIPFVDYSWLHSSLIEGAFPFALGGLLYHYKSIILKKLGLINSPALIVILLLFFTVNPAAALICEELFGIEIERISHWINYLLNFVLIAMLIEGKIPLLNKKVDKLIGDYSYPIYLAHWQIGFLSSMLLFNEPIRGASLMSLKSFTLAVLIIFGVATFIIYAVDRPIEVFRKYIKGKAMK